MDSSYTWVNNFEHESLGYILADAGFDVWLGNNRGNTFSLRNVYFPSTSDAFWNTTFDQMAQYDMPAQVDYVRNATGQSKIGYVGHSQGTTQAFAALSLDSTASPFAKAAAGISQKLTVFAALAPVTRLKYQQSELLALVCPLVADFDISKVLRMFGMRDFLPGPGLLDKLDPKLCAASPLLCDDVLFMCTGKSTDLNNTRLPVYTSETPAGTPTKDMGHWAQLANSGSFQMFNYGCDTWPLTCGNEEQYGQKTAPQYDLTRITGVPILLSHGGLDDLGDPKDVAWLMSQLPAATLAASTLVPSFSHMDFVWGVQAHQLVYPQVVEMLKKYSNTTATAATA